MERVEGKVPVNTDFGTEFALILNMLDGVVPAVLYIIPKYLLFCNLFDGCLMESQMTIDTIERDAEVLT